MKHLKSIFLLLLGTTLFSCNNYSSEMKENRADVNSIKESFLLFSSKKITAEQKYLKDEIIQVLCDYIVVDTAVNHFYFTMSPQEMQRKEIPAEVFSEIFSDIEKINAYSDSTGTGRELILSWEQSKAEFLKNRRDVSE